MAEYNDADTMEFPAPVIAERKPETISSRVKVDIGALSHEGKVRPNNEDSFLVSRFERIMRTLLTNLPEGYVSDQYSEIGYGMLVADGMGGAAAGEVASRTAISALVELVLQTPDWIMRPDEGAIEKVQQRFEERFGKLGDALTRRARTDPNLTGMGTTMTLAASIGADLVVAHVGDSRAYLFRLGQLMHLTRDQTVAQVLADAGVIRPEEVATHRGRHVLTGVIAMQGEKAEVELHHLRLIDGDQILICSDGLTEMVTDALIVAVLEKHGPAQDACRTLVDLALNAGGKDNVTVILGRYHIPEEK